MDERCTHIGGLSEVMRERIAGGSSIRRTGCCSCAMENGMIVELGCEDIMVSWDGCIEIRVQQEDATDWTTRFAVLAGSDSP